MIQLDFIRKEQDYFDLYCGYSEQNPRPVNLSEFGAREISCQPLGVPFIFLRPCDIICRMNLISLVITSSS